MSAFPPLSEIDEVRLALYRAVRERGHADESNALELTTNTEVEITGNTARVTSVRLVLGGVPRDPHIVSGERVVDELVRGADGSWTVVRRSPQATS